MAYLLAAYREYLKYHTDDKGEKFEIAEPWLTNADRKLIESDDARAFLALSPFAALDFGQSPEFLALYDRFCEEIHSKGAYETLINF